MDRSDFFLLIGVLLITIGGALIYLPLGFIVLGLACVSISIIGAKNAATQTTIKH
jgi:hypothetical protein